MVNKIPNAALVFRDIPPSGTPIIPGKTLRREVGEIDLDADLGEGEVLIKVKALSLDPYMRGRLRDANIKSYSGAFELNKPIVTRVTGKVLKSKSAAFPEGSVISASTTFSEYAVLSAKDLETAKNLDEQPVKLPYSAWLGVAGMPSLTAWRGLYQVDDGPVKGNTIFVSGAAGAVGQVVVQLSKREGLKVIGSAGSDEKVAFLKEIGVDVAWNYKTESTREILEKHPFDVFWDNVGGETLDDVLATINDYGRIISCGGISTYNSAPYGVTNTMQIVAKSLTIRGFIVGLVKGDVKGFYDLVPPLVASGEIKFKEHITKGIDNGEALVGVYEGSNFGKAIVSLE